MKNIEQYSVHDLKCITENPEAYVKQCTEAYYLFQKNFNDTDSTWNYWRYNFFAMMGKNILLYNLLKEVSSIVRKKIGDDIPIWCQSWINFHKNYEVLDWHTHDWEFHGYISIDPKKTKTIFRDWSREDSTGDEWEIENEAGKLYLGPGDIPHKVNVIEPYEGNRITIGLDFSTKPQNSEDIDLVKYIPIF
jgi:hypothetical protein